MCNCARLKVADVIGRVVDELHVSNAALMRLFEPFKLHLKEIQALNIPNDSGLSRPMRRLKIGRGKRTLQAVIGHHLVDPGQSIEMIVVKESRFWRAKCGEYACRVSAEDGTIRDIGEACDSE